MALEAERMGRLVEESSYVFRGTVRQLNASNEPTIRPGPNQVIVHVDEAFRASPSLGVAGLRGRDVTLLLAAVAPRLGDRLLVFANDWVYGVQVALREVRHFEATEQREREIAEAINQLPARHLRARLEGAALVIEGEVERIEPSPIPDGERLRSPYYQLAVVRVASKLKGECGEHVNVLFPTNPAPPWRTAPRLKEHESALFVLRHETELKAPPEFFTALDPADVRPRDELNRIRTLLR